MGILVPFQPEVMEPREDFLPEQFGGCVIASWGNRMGGFDRQTVSITTTIKNI